LPRLIF